MASNTKITMASRSNELTKREQQVFALVAQGLSNKLIADAIGISDHTAKFHLYNLYGKLGVTNRTQAAVRYATLQATLQVGALDVGDPELAA